MASQQLGFIEFFAQVSALSLPPIAGVRLGVLSSARLTLLAVALIAVGCSNPTEEVSGRGEAEPSAAIRGVVLVVIDALRADHLHSYGYGRPTSPSMDRLAAEGVRFSNALSPSPWTLPALATLMTSLYPSIHDANLQSDLTGWMNDRQNFKPANSLHESRLVWAEILQSEGFATAGFVRGSYPSAAFGFAQGFDLYLANPENRAPSIRSSVEALFQWLGSVDASRFFAYLHTVEVHSPYFPPIIPLSRWGMPPEQLEPMQRVVAEETARYGKIDFDPDYAGDIDGSWENMREIHAGKALSERDIEHLVALYDRGILYTDYWIGRIVEELKRSGFYDETLIIVTSDHGDEFFEHGGFEHGHSLYDELLRVPLIMKVPGEGRGVVVSDQVGLIDVLPTVLDLLGIDEDVPLQGRSLRPLWLGRDQAPHAYFGEAAYDSELLALRTERWKYVSAGRGAGGRREELFDLRQDPMEQANRCPQESENCARLREQARAWKDAQDAFRATLLMPEGVPATVDETTAEQLRLLGYIE